MPKVSVIIPVFNGEKFVKEAVESVFGQTFEDYEAIIVDDGSTDKTAEIARGFESRQPAKVRYVRQDNKGLPGARNTGIQKAKGEYIALLDADDMWYPHHLRDCVEVLEERPDVGLVHANVERIWEDGSPYQVPKRDARCLSGRIFRHLFLRDAHISCPTAVFRKSCTEKIGLFDENLSHLGCEDREFWLRLSREYDIYYIDDVHAKYRMTDNSMSRDNEKMFKARKYVVDKFASEQGSEKLKSKAMAHIYREVADDALYMRDFQEAQKYYWEAIRLEPLDLWHWVNLAKSKMRIRVKPVYS